MRGVSKDLHGLIRQLRQLGYTVEHGGKHLKVKTTEGKTISTLSVSTSSQSALRKARSSLRREGVPL